MTDKQAIQLTYWDAIEPKVSSLWQGYTPDISDETAADAFRAKYGYEPKKQKRYASILLVGPIFEEEDTNV